MSGSVGRDFARDGLAVLRGAVAPGVVASVRDRIWAEAERRREIRRDDPASWARVPPSLVKRLREQEGLFEPLWTEPVRSAIDELLEGRRWTRPPVLGQLLMSPPDASRWALPHKVWHMDFPAPGWVAETVPGVQLFFLLDDLASEQGGTLFVTGSHRLVGELPERRKQGYAGHSAELRRALRVRVPWLRELWTEDADPAARRRFLDEEATHDGVPLRVHECTGRAGDVYLMHPWLVHNASPNLGPAMRIMATERILADDVNLYTWNRKAQGGNRNARAGA